MSADQTVSTGKLELWFELVARGGGREPEVDVGSGCRSAAWSGRGDEGEPVKDRLGDGGGHGASPR